MPINTTTSRLQKLILFFVFLVLVSIGTQFWLIIFLNFIPITRFLGYTQPQQTNTEWRTGRDIIFSHWWWIENTVLTLKNIRLLARNPELAQQYFTEKRVVCSTENLPIRHNPMIEFTVFRIRMTGDEHLSHLYSSFKWHFIPNKREMTPRSYNDCVDIGRHLQLDRQKKTYHILSVGRFSGRLQRRYPVAALGHLTLPSLYPQFWTGEMKINYSRITSSRLTIVNWNRKRDTLTTSLQSNDRICFGRYCPGDILRVTVEPNWTRKKFGSFSVQPRESEFVTSLFVTIW